MAIESDRAALDVQAVAEAIRRYLAQRPQAFDTAVGIQRWWLLPEYGEVSLQTVEAALAQLEQEGFVLKQEQAWSPATYRRAAPLAG